jgi:hypothetical protein
MDAPADPTVDEVARRFAAEGCDLALSTIATGCLLAAATNPGLGGAGPMAMGDTGTDAARLAWSRFEAHREHYLMPLDPAGPDGGTALRRLRHAGGLSQQRLATAARVNLPDVPR